MELLPRANNMRQKDWQMVPQVLTTCKTMRNCKDDTKVLISKHFNLEGEVSENQEGTILSKQRPGNNPLNQKVIKVVTSSLVLIESI